MPTHGLKRCGRANRTKQRSKVMRPRQVRPDHSRRQKPQQLRKAATHVQHPNRAARPPVPWRPGTGWSEPCPYCEGTGGELIETQAIEIEDLDQMTGV